MKKIFVVFFMVKAMLAAGELHLVSDGYNANMKKYFKEEEGRYLLQAEEDTKIHFEGTFVGHGIFQESKAPEEIVFIGKEGYFRNDSMQRRFISLSSYGGLENKTCSIGTKEIPMEIIDIQGVNRFTHEGLISQHNSINNQINLIGKEIRILREENAYRRGNKNILIGIFSEDSSINLEAEKSLEMDGNISSGLALGWPDGYQVVNTENRNFSININKNSSSTPIMKIRGNITTGNFEGYSGNRVYLKMNHPESSFTGMILDVNPSNDREGTELVLENGARWNVIDEEELLSSLGLDFASSISNLSLSNGAVVDLSYQSSGLRNLNIEHLKGEHGIFRLNMDASKKENNTDRIYLTTHEGLHYIELVPLSRAETALEGTVVATVKEEKGEFQVKEQETPLYWNAYDLGTKASETEDYNVDWYLRKGIRNEEKKTTGVATIVSANLINYYIWQNEHESMAERIGAQSFGERKQAGFWFKERRANYRRKDDLDFNGNLQSQELGWDKTIKKNSNQELFQGLSLSLTEGTTNYKKGFGRNRNFAIKYYLSSLHSNAYYSDLVFKAGHLRHRFDVRDSREEKIEGKHTNYAFSLSSEHGYRKYLGRDFYLEPQIQLFFSYLKGKEYQSSNQLLVKPDSMKSFVSKLGFHVGRECEGCWICYLKCHVSREYLGDYDLPILYEGEKREEKGNFKETKIEYGLGAKFQFHEKAHVYFDLSQNIEKNFEKYWKANFGFRYSFS